MKGLLDLKCLFSRYDETHLYSKKDQSNNLIHYQYDHSLVDIAPKVYLMVLLEFWVVATQSSICLKIALFMQIAFSISC